MFFTHFCPALIFLCTYSLMIPKLHNWVSAIRCSSATDARDYIVPHMAFYK